MPPSAPTPSKEHSLVQGSSGSPDEANGGPFYPPSSPLLDLAKESETSGSFQTNMDPSMSHSQAVDLGVHTVSNVNGVGLWNSAGTPGGMGILSPYAGTSSLLYGGGANMMGFGGGLMSPYMSTGPLSSLTQTLMGVQTLVVSVGQTMQIVSLNAEAIQHLLTSAKTTLLQAMESWRLHQHEWEAYYRHQSAASTHHSWSDAEGNQEARRAHARQRRRRQALRWILVTAVTYVGYTVVRKLLAFLLRSTRQLESSPPVAPLRPDSNAASAHPYGSSPAYPYGSSPAYPYGGPPPTSSVYPPPYAAPYSYSTPYHASSPYGPSAPYSNSYYGNGQGYS